MQTGTGEGLLPHEGWVPHCYWRTTGYRLEERVGPGPDESLRRVLRPHPPEETGLRSRCLETVSVAVEVLPPSGVWWRYV